MDILAHSVDSHRIDGGRCRAAQFRKIARQGQSVTVVDDWPPGGVDVVRGIRAVVHQDGRLLCKVVANRKTTMRALQNAVLQHLGIHAIERQTMLRASARWHSNLPLLNSGPDIAFVEIDLPTSIPLAKKEGPLPSPQQVPFVEEVPKDRSDAHDGGRFSHGCSIGSELHYAILAGDLEFSMALLADRQFTRVNAKDGDGRTALHLAAACGYTGVCSAIVRRPDFKEVDGEDCNGCSAYALAPLAQRR